MTKSSTFFRRALPAVFLLSLGFAHAQPAASEPVPVPGAVPAPVPVVPAPSKGEALAARQFGWLDTNGDGYLSREEVALFPRLRDAFDQADANHDNRVSLDEIRTVALQRRAAKAEAAATPATVAPPETTTPPAAVQPAAPIQNW